jgi:hypothetical protein
VSDDAELIEYVRTRVGAEHGLTEAQSRRLVGTTLKALHDDASSMAKELDVDERQRRHATTVAATRAVSTTVHR